MVGKIIYSNCCHWIPNAKNYRCSLAVMENYPFSKRYNCKKNGICSWFKTNEDREKEIADFKEESDRKNYERLKKKFESKQRENLK